MKTTKIIIGLALILYLNMQATLIQELKSQAADLEQGKAGVVEGQKGLKDAYAKINQQVIDAINKNLPTLDQKVNDLTSTIKALNDIPENALTIIAILNPNWCIRDLRPVLNWIVENPVKTIRTTLTETRDSFMQANKPLDPATDPQKVYATLASAEKHFQNAIDRMIAITKALSELRDAD